MVLTHILQEFNFSVGFIWVIAGEQLVRIKWNAEDLVNDFLPFFSHVLWDKRKQTVTWFYAKGPSSLPQLPGAKMALINCSTLNWNCAECIYTADACRNPLSKECDISGGEWQSSRVCQHMSVLSIIYRASSVWPSKCQRQHSGLKGSQYCECCKVWAGF